MEWFLYGFLALWGVLFLYLGDKNKSQTSHKNNDDFDFQKTENTFDEIEINPATGKIMLDGSGVDTSGNPYGFDHRSFNECSSCRDVFQDNHWNRYD